MFVGGVMFLAVMVTENNRDAASPDDEEVAAVQDMDQANSMSAPHTVTPSLAADEVLAAEDEVFAEPDDGATWGQPVDNAEPMISFSYDATPDNPGQPDFDPAPVAETYQDEVWIED
ncbi:hypothetical protein GCM10009127_11090 [Alteraurantiacibacter aestuarii]